MDNFFEEFDKRFTKKNEEDGTSVESILVKLADQIKDRFGNKGLDATVTAASGTSGNTRTISLYLFTLLGNNYNYRLMNISQPIDNDLPLTATAFLNPPTNEKTFENFGDFTNWIKNEVVGNVRMRMVTDHLEQMGLNISEWREDVDGNTIKKNLIRNQLQLMPNHAGAFQLKNGTLMNFGSKKLQDDIFIFYTRKGLDEIFSLNADKTKAALLLKETDESLKRTGHLDEISIDQIEKILF
jgi:hypothetical protein